MVKKKDSSQSTNKDSLENHKALLDKIVNFIYLSF